MKQQTLLLLCGLTCVANLRGKHNHPPIQLMQAIVMEQLRPTVDCKTGALGNNGTQVTWLILEVFLLIDLTGPTMAITVARPLAMVIHLMIHRLL